MRRFKYQKFFVLLLLIPLFTLSWAGSAEAKTKSSKKTSTKRSKVTKKGTSAADKSQLGTSFSFDVASVRGKYQMAGQGLAVVEDEKVLDDLLGMRSQFKDREKQEASRR